MTTCHGACALGGLRFSSNFTSKQRINATEQQYTLQAEAMDTSAAIKTLRASRCVNNASDFFYFSKIKKIFIGYFDPNNIEF